MQIRIQFDSGEHRVAPGAELRLPALVWSDFDGSIDVTYDAEVSGEQSAEFRCAVAGPSHLRPGQATPVAVTVSVPRDAAGTAQPRTVRLLATLVGTQASAAGETSIIVGDRPCAAFSTPPELNVAADGTVTATVRVLNCGPFTLTVKLQVRHVEGWTFDVDTPAVTVSAQSGPLTVRTVLRPPPGRSAHTGDDVRFELLASDVVIASVDVPVQPPTTRGPTEPRSTNGDGRPRIPARIVVGAVAVLAAVLVGWPVLRPSAGEGSEAVSSAPPSESLQPTATAEPEPIEVPFLLLLNIDTAVATLESVGLEANSTVGSVPDEVLKPGRLEQATVIAQDPDAGDSADGGTVVTLTVTPSAGAILPDLVGQPLDEAEAEVDELGLLPRPDATTPQQDDCALARPVTEQEPGAGSWVPQGAEVTLTYPACSQVD